MNVHSSSNSRLTVVHNFPIWLPQTQTWMYNQVLYLPNEVANYIVCKNTENLEQFMLPNIYSLADAPKWRKMWERGLRKLRLQQRLGFLVERSKRYRAQILHSHFGPVGWESLIPAKQANLKHIVSFYGVDVNHLPKHDLRWYERYQQLFAQVDLILCEGSHMAKCIVELGCPQDKIQLHHLGVSVEKIPYKPRVWKPTEPLSILIAASFTEKKGIPYALEALGRLQRYVELKITIIGDARNDMADSQFEKQQILSIIQKHRLQSKIRLLGYQPHKVLFREAYKHHIFLSPSVTANNGNTEGGAPVSIIEMAATGMPIVSTTHCDIPEIIKDNITGLLAEERNVDGLVQRLGWLVDYPEKWREILDAGRKHIETEYNAQVQGKKLATIYQKVVNL